MTPWLLLALAGVILAVLTSGRARPEGSAQAAANAVLGLAALAAVHWTAAYTGLQVGINLFNAAVAGVLGIPGVVLLILVQWVYR